MGIHEQDTAVASVDAPLQDRRSSEQHGCLVLIYRHGGLPLGKRINLDRSVIRIGRATDNDLVLEDQEVSRRHARIESRESGWVLMDAGSTNGTFLDGRELDGCVALAPGALFKLGSHIFKFLSGSGIEAAFHDEIYRLTITDNLTNLPNQRALLDEVGREFSRARRHRLPTSFLMLDIDLFKRVNDEHGHQAGDAVLAHVASVIRSQARAGDTVARYGGEELAVLMPQTSLSEAARVAERIREAVQLRACRYRGLRINVSVSIGCAELTSDDAAFEAVIHRADERLYAAKHSGRNRVAS